MRLYDITQQGELIFLSRNDAQKWQDLQTCSNIAICLLHPDYGQLICEGSVELKTNENDPDSIRLYWKMMDKNIQKIYLPDSSSSINKSLTQVPNSFGVICIKPRLWEILKICKEYYLKSERKQFLLVDGSWEMKTLNPI